MPATGMLGCDGVTQGSYIQVCMDLDVTSPVGAVYNDARLIPSPCPPMPHAVEGEDGWHMDILGSLGDEDRSFDADGTWTFSTNFTTDQERFCWKTRPGRDSELLTCGLPLYNVLTDWVTASQITSILLFTALCLKFEQIVIFFIYM